MTYILVRLVELHHKHNIYGGGRDGGGDGPAAGTGGGGDGRRRGRAGLADGCGGWFGRRGIEKSVPTLWMEDTDYVLLAVVS